ncbi:hypothetical protein CFLV_02010 [Corynebacterium flavescens]|uniref:Uncharacterized protein n=1 Tax=Corynebacterium flavescens TaxID=28028 RepID=A0A1L7CJP3_CORFL|nr:hypothetical protein CFLV_02010 [Corynebacterium flavescens]
MCTADDRDKPFVGAGAFYKLRAGGNSPTGGAHHHVIALPAHNRAVVLQFEDCHGGHASTRGWACFAEHAGDKTLTRMLLVDGSEGICHIQPIAGHGQGSQPIGVLAQHRALAIRAGNT